MKLKFHDALLRDDDVMDGRLTLGQTEQNFVHGNSPDKNGKNWEYIFLATSPCFDMVDVRGVPNPTFFSQNFQTFSVSSQIQLCSTPNDNSKSVICDDDPNDEKNIMFISFHKEIKIDPLIIDPEALFQQIQTRHILIQNGVPTYGDSFSTGDEICIKSEIVNSHQDTLALSPMKQSACVLDLASLYYTAFEKEEPAALAVGCDKQAWAQIGIREMHANPVKFLIHPENKKCSDENSARCTMTCWNTSSLSMSNTAIFLDVSERLDLNDSFMMNHFILGESPGLSAQIAERHFRKMLRMRGFDTLTEGDNHDCQNNVLLLPLFISALVVVILFIGMVILIIYCTP
jgi:hypothetical protein